MCELFINANSDLWSSKTKSLRIQGMVTSIRLEVFFWNILEELSFRDHMTVNESITKLYLESLDAGHDTGNFTSFLRVCCSRYLSLIADGDLSRQLEELTTSNKGCGSPVLYRDPSPSDLDLKLMQDRCMSVSGKCYIGQVLAYGTSK